MATTLTRHSIMRDGSARARVCRRDRRPCAMASSPASLQAGAAPGRGGIAMIGSCQVIDQHIDVDEQRPRPATWGWPLRLPAVSGNRMPAAALS